MRKIYIALAAWPVALGLFAAALIGFGGPAQPAPLASVGKAFEEVDFSDLPAPRQYLARDGVLLSYALYPAAHRRASVVLVHGSAADFASLHPLARHLRDNGYDVYSLDVRGHGHSGEKGRIDYIGQLEDDLDDFLASVNPAGPRLLGGFSAGGGFALRYAGSARQKSFAGYLLLAPFVHHEAPNARPDAGGWVSVGLPRIAGLAGLNALGIDHFNHLPVLRFALSDAASGHATPFYDYDLAFNFRGPEQYPQGLQNLGQPMAVVAGNADEIFVSDTLEDIFSVSPVQVPVTLVPELDHVGVTVDPAGHAAATAALERLLGSAQPMIGSRP
ncbi:alpha/beta hydrolase [Pseudomonas mangrovi]|uniref:Alpha/beta hydrolase n=1 Tax=Pseudomonas mangrovi TaxID=2161748 RepID=A0A2T5P9T2_9PSED|nr:alpha/beta fold hydrolase [Pseudomonas mangrovi]PTU74462.1 alpha/beta hydrolase [Pseudomonas mangrovi]